jgi:hypothetical protein
MYGVEVHYIPRKYATEKTIIREVIQSKFDQAHPIEAYVNNYEGYGDNTTILSKFGIQATNEIELIISKERYEQYISPLLKDKANVKLTTRPKEGDLIYFPLGDRIFEIKFVEHEKPFYQLRKNYVYVLKCELFRMEQNDILDTGISEVDDVLTGISTNLDDGYVTFGSVQTLTMVGAGVTATASISQVLNGSIQYITVTNRGGGYSSAPTVAISSAPSGGTTGIATAVMISGIVVCTDNVNPNAKSVQSVNLVNPGSGYTTAPGIRFIGGGGGGAAATSMISAGSIGPITVSNAGSGYTVAPPVTFTGISTVSAAATAVVSSAGTITAITITNAGTGYTEAPTVTIGSPYLSGIGTYIFNEVITGSTSGTTARVRSWNVNTSVLEIASASGEFVSGETVVGEDSEASYMIRAITEFEASDGFSSNDDIETEADAIIDFSERNPFGQA